MRVLVAVDGSAGAAAAAGWLPHLPLPESAQVRVLTAVTLPGWPADLATAPEYYVGLLDEGDRIAAEGRAALLARWPRAEAEVLRGDARDCLLAAARQWQPDLLVVGARGLGALASALLGSVSAAVARQAACSVLVVKGHPRRLGRAVVALDGSADSLAATRFIAALPLRRDLSLRLLAVADAPPAPIATAAVLGAPGAAVSGGLLDERRRALEGVLERAAADFASRVALVERSVVTGRPAAEIIGAASEPGVDLVVVGARGLGFLGRVILGSVSEEVLQHAPCPVLIVREPGGAARAAP